MTTSHPIGLTIGNGILDLLEKIAPFIPHPEGPALLIGVTVARRWIAGQMTDAQIAVILGKTEKEAQEILDTWDQR
jgi:hypothetical protein